jgi:hypothetical protein
MKLRLLSTLAALAGLAAPACADEALTQTTITIRAGGKPVAGLIMPIGAKGMFSGQANRVEHGDSDGGQQIRFSGNVQGRFTPPAGADIVLYADDIAIDTVPVSAERARAVRDLDAMAGPDQLYRGRADIARLTPDEWARQSAIDSANMKRLDEIIGAFGWPGLRFAGSASQTAFLVLQHADSASQHKYLPLMREAVRRNDAQGSQLALLEDRVRVSDGKPQLYGTQLTGDPLRFAPIEDEARVDERRRSVGLPPLADYAKMFGLSYAPAPAPAATR